LIWLKLARKPPLHSAVGHNAACSRRFTYNTCGTVAHYFEWRMTDKLGRWVFLHAGAGGWEWRRLHEESGIDVQRSERVFRSLLECIRDATAHGYLAPGHDEPATPRRRQ